MKTNQTPPLSIIITTLSLGFCALVMIDYLFIPTRSQVELNKIDNQIEYLIRQSN